MHRNWRGNGGRRYQSAKGHSRYPVQGAAQENIQNALGMTPIDSRLSLAAVLAVSRDLYRLS